MRLTAPYNKSMEPGRSVGIGLETHPDQYRHWRLSIEPPLATLTMAVSEEEPLVPGYKLKLNSYDLGVDIELADAITRLRFEHPEVRAVIVTGGLDRVFCAGANIHMLASSTHSFKVNFCKYTNETRLAIEDACAHSGQHYIAACNGATAGGGYELALACEEIYLVDDGNSTVSLPEVPLLGVLPGTGGLTRVVDKRKVRRDLADVFCTLAEGIKGKRAVEWRLIDGVFPRGRFAEAVRKRALELAAGEPSLQGPGIALDTLSPEVNADSVRYRHVELELDHENRTAELIVRGPEGVLPDTRDAIQRAGADFWPLRAFREIDDALLRLRFHHDNIGLLILKTRGDLDAVREVDTALYRLREDWLPNEILLFMARTLRRLDLTARSMFAVVDESSCFAGSLLEMALAADRIYMLRDADDQVAVASSPLNAGLLPMTHGLSRLAVRFMAEPEHAAEIVDAPESFDTDAAEKAGLVTAAVDAIDWEDELRGGDRRARQSLARCLDRHGGEPAVCGRRKQGQQNLRASISLAKLDFLAAQCNRRARGADALRQAGAAAIRLAEDLMSLYERIPNNVNLSNDKRLVRALEHWLPKYMQWWSDMGPEGFQADDVYLRTAVSVEPGGWAHFDYVKMPDYRWGIFLAPPEHDRRVGFGDHLGKPAWQEVPGEYRNMLRRLIVTQGDTEPASVEQQRLLGQTAPCLYDLRNLFQVNVEEGRHLWAMVYLLHSHFGRDGREESEELLERRSGSSDKPRILEAFNEPIADWLSFYMFTTFTDRDGKYQLLALAESGFDPLSRTTRFMLTEEAHHMFVGEAGVRRVAGAPHVRVDARDGG